MTYLAVISKRRTAVVFGSTPHGGFASVDDARAWIADYARTTEGAFRWTIAHEDASDVILDSGVGGLRSGWTLDDQDQIVKARPPEPEAADKDSNESA